MYNCEQDRLKKLVHFKLPESSESFNSFYNIYKNHSVNPNSTFRDLFKLRHSSLMDLNNFLFDSEQEKKYDMREEDVEGWKVYEKLSERYRIADFFFTRVVDEFNKNLSNGN